MPQKLMLPDRSAEIRELGYSWEKLQERLTNELRYNPLDSENPPIDGTVIPKRGDDPLTLVFGPDVEIDEETNPFAQNSKVLLNTIINKWEIPGGLPNMVLLVHGGNRHPLLLVDTGTNARAEFLKSRPQFGVEKFDGQRDPAEGWISAWNAWRNPAFNTEPQSAAVVFTFQPPHTLFIDALIQAENDPQHGYAELIQPGDRTKNEVIIDAVTHQTISRQAAMKGADNVFYWDLSVKPREEAPGLIHGAAQEEGDLRRLYDEWWGGMRDAPGGINVRLTKGAGKSPFLIGKCDPVRVKKWESFVQRKLAREEERKVTETQGQLAEGEIRVEIRQVRVSKQGLLRMGVLNPAAAQGDGLILIKIAVPGDPQDVTDAFPMRRGIAKVTPMYSKRAAHDAGSARSDELFDILHNPDPEKSNLTISVYLCNKNGAELTGTDKHGSTVSKGHIGTTTCCLKDMVRDANSETVSQDGWLELAGIVGQPKEAEGKKKKPKKSKSDSKKDLKSDLKDDDDDDDELDDEEEEKPLGEVKVTIKVRQPTKRGGSAPVGAAAADAGSGEGGAQNAEGETMPSDMLELARMAIARKSELKDLKGKQAPKAAADAAAPDDGAGVGVAPASEQALPPESQRASQRASVTASPAPQVAQAAAAEEEDDEVIPAGGPVDAMGVGTLSRLMLERQQQVKATLTYTFAYWIKWRPVDPIGDQMLFFGEPRNQPTLIRGSKLGALVDNQFCATEYDPRLAGDNWQLLIVTNDGLYSKFYIGFSSLDDSGAPVPARAQEPDPTRDAADVRTPFSAGTVSHVLQIGQDDGRPSNAVKIKRLKTEGKGAGLLAQAWIWPRDLQPDEIRELWMETKKRYPVAKRGLPGGGLPKMAYREPPSLGRKGGLEPIRPTSAKKDEKDKATSDAKKKGGGERDRMPWEIDDPIAEKDIDLMLEVPLSAKLAFQKLAAVFVVLVDYAFYSSSFIVIDRIHNMSCTAELMLEVALRKGPANMPTVLLIDSRERLQLANMKLKQLIDAGFLLDEENYSYVKGDGFPEKGPDGLPKKHKKLLAHEYAVDLDGNMGAHLRRLVSPKGLTWLRATPEKLKDIEELMATMPIDMPKEVKTIYRDIRWQHGSELHRDGRPKLQYIWKNFYAAQLFASATHYIIFNDVEPRGKPIVSYLGQPGTIFLNGSTETYKKIQAVFQAGDPLLLLESTGGVTQAFAHAFKAVRRFGNDSKKGWNVDYVMRLVTEYKMRAVRDKAGRTYEEVLLPKKYTLPNIHLLDRELARIDLILSQSTDEQWMTNFGLPDILMLFEVWQKAKDFMLRQIQTTDVMRINAEDLLDKFTQCFSSAGATPELGLGNAEIKVVATAWNRHLLLYNNARIYSYRCWIMQFSLYLLGFMTTMLSIFTTNSPVLSNKNEQLGFIMTQIMIVLPIITALLGTISTRLRTKEKFSVCKMASFSIVSEIYQFRARAMTYESASIQALLEAKANPDPDKKKDDSAVKIPIPASKRDAAAREIFVENVNKIYSDCMTGEMSKGTSITHSSNFGMDPALLLPETIGPDESQKDTLRQLEMHVANRLYFMTTEEWVRGVDFVKKQRGQERDKQIEKFQKKVQTIAGVLLRLLVSILLLAIELSIRISACVLSRVRGAAGGLAVPGGIPLPGKSATSGDDDVETGDATAANAVNRTQERIKYYKEKYFDKYLNVGDAVGAMADALTEQTSGENNLTLDEKVYEGDEEEADATTAPTKSAGSASGSGVRKARPKARDDFFSSLPIKDYYDYRAKAILSYLEATAPWRGFWMQLIEILIFVLASLGAVLVGLDAVPYVALTVAAAQIARSFLEFSNLGKQVEGYNQAINQIHTMMNQWDQMTRTKRQTPQTRALVVSTVESSMNIVAYALTDALPKGSDDGDGGDDGDGEEEKK